MKEKQRGDFADLLIVDGGKGQLNIAMQILQDLEIATIDVIGLTKEDARHDKGLTQEKIYVPYRKDPYFIDPRSPLLFLLQKIRDEAHRTAIEFHRKRRDKRTISSSLDHIEGIGPVKKKILLKKFGSVKAIKEATRKELLATKGITQKDAETLIRALYRS
jgi:excinuclease ABC subunit C